MLDTKIGSGLHGTSRHQAPKPVKVNANRPRRPEHKVREQAMPEQDAVQ